MKYKFIGLACALAMGAFSCAEKDNSGESTQPTVVSPTKWQGEKRHLVVAGTVDGERVDFELTEDEAADSESLFCERNYVVPNLNDVSTWTDGVLEKIELKWRRTVDGTEREYQIELSAHDFSASKDGSQLDVVTYDAEATLLEKSSVQASFEWQYEAGDSEVERGAESEKGSFDRGLLKGTPGEAMGVVVPDGEGAFGGYLHLSWKNGDVVDVSFTAECADNDLDIPE